VILRRPLYYELYPAITCDKKWAACTLKILVGMRQCSLQCGSFVSPLSAATQASNTSQGGNCERTLENGSLLRFRNIACNLQHEGTAEWFCGGNTFQEWKATQWFLTVDSRKTYGPLTLYGFHDLTDCAFRSWLCKERSMVSHSLTLAALWNSFSPISSAIIQKITALRG
jgi:hypothetical protein